MIYITVGLPGSGKTTWAEAFAREKGIPYFNTDYLMWGIYGQLSNNSFTKTRGTFQELVVLFKRAHESVVIDSCNTTRLAQKIWDDTFHNYPIEWHVFDTPVEECIARQQNRDRKTPESMIRKMAETLSFPSNSIFHSPGSNVN